MDQQRLVRELEQLKTGEPESEFRFLSVLASSNAFLLADDTESPLGGGDKVGEKVIVRPHLVRRDGYVAACLFSSVEQLTAWCARRGMPARWVGICGIDLAVALPADTWLEIDPDMDRSVTLSPAHLTLLGSAFSSEVGMTPDVPLPPEDEDEFVDGFEMVDSRATHGVPQYRVSSPQGADEQKPAAGQTCAPEGAPAKRRFNRSNPTTMFEAPKLERKAEVERPRTYTSSNLKKVIRPPKSGDDE